MTGRSYAYYPGCTHHSTGLEYGHSTQAVCKALGIELVEIPDWNCCGASSAHSLHAELAFALPARNIMLAQELQREIAIPCAACYGHLAAANWRMNHDATFRERMERLTGRQFENAARPRALLDVLTDELSEEVLRPYIRHPLTGLRPVSYYGCLLLRPPHIAGGWDDTEHPHKLDVLLGWIGATPQDWSYATDCCGASMTLNRSDVVLELVGRLVEAAEEAGANCIVAACPLCHVNLDARQGRRSRKLPIFYFTELLGLAMGIEGTRKLLARHIVNPLPLVEQSL